MKNIPSKRFREIIEKQLPYVTDLIPMNYILEKFYVVGQHHKVMAGERKKTPDIEPIAVSQADSGRRTFEIYFNKDGSEWKAEELEAQIFGALMHEFQHVEQTDVIEIAEKESVTTKSIINKIDESCCISVERTAKWAWKEIFEKRKS